MASKLICSSKLFRPQTLKFFSSRLQSTLIEVEQSLEQSLHNAPETNISALSNGLRVASEDNGGETCTVGIWIDTGSRFENEANNGITHFLDHMIFKGTQNRSQLQLETEVESMGAHLNAYTSREQTAYYAKCLKKDLPAIVNILGDAVQNPLFDEHTIEKERSVILKEVQELDTNLEEVVFDHLHATAYQGTPLGMSVVGTTQNIKSISKADLHSYVNTHFSTPRLAIAAAGGVNHDELVKLVEQNFTNLPTSIGAEAKLETCRFTGSAVSDRNDWLPLAHVALAVEGCGWTHPDFFTLEVAKMIVGSWSRSMGGFRNAFGQLAQCIHEHHFAESYNLFNLCYTDTGLFGTHFVCDPMEIDNMIFSMQREWMRICTSVIQSDLDRAKNALKTNLLQLDGTTATCEDIGRQLLTYNRRMPLAELNKRIDMVDIKSVKQVCTKYIYDKSPAVAAVGPVEGLTDYNRIVGGMYWLRL